MSASKPRAAAALTCLSLLCALGCSGGDEGGPEQADGVASDGTPVDGVTGDGATGDGATGDGGSDGGQGVTIGPPRTLDLCAGDTALVYAPFTSASLDVFPDDLWTVASAETPTGLRVQVDADTPWVGALPASFQPVIQDLGRLDGWGTTASLFVRFSGPLAALPSGATASVASAGVQLWQLEPTAKRVPFESALADDGTTALFAPMVPLRPKSRHALLITRAQQAADGGCIAPSPTLAQVLQREVTDPALKGRVLALEAALAASGVAAKDVSAATVFTTQSVVEESVAVAEDIAKRTFTWKQPITCKAVSGKPYRKCEGTFVGQDYRKDREVQPTPSGPLEHRVRVWLPKSGDGPWPVVLFGHGLTGAKDQGEPLAAIGAPLGVASVAIDAPHHGEHPAGASVGLATVLGFFGIDAAKLGFDFLALRDNWRQATFDKLQLLRLIQQQPDADGDGKPDLDPSRVAYVGVSLGGIMGAELLALSGAVDVGILSVPGGRVSSIIESSEQFSPIILAFKPEGTTAGDVARFFPILQTLLERGDAANWGPHVLANRLPVAGAQPPSVLLQMAIDDDVVPNVANRALARAMGTPQVGPELQPVGIVQGGVTLPVSGNVSGVTAGVFQFDRITKSKGGKVQDAKHGNVPASREALEQDKAFLQAWLDGDAPVIIDPFKLLSTPPLKSSP